MQRATSNWCVFSCKQVSKANKLFLMWISVNEDFIITFDSCVGACHHPGWLWFCKGAGSGRENLLICWYSWVHGSRDHQEPGTWLCSWLLVSWHPDFWTIGGKVITMIIIILFFFNQQRHKITLMFTSRWQQHCMAFSELSVSQFQVSVFLIPFNKN